MVCLRMLLLAGGSARWAGGRRVLGWACCVVSSALASAQELASAQKLLPYWTIENLSGSPGQNSTAHGINDEGVIAGRSNNRASMWALGHRFELAAVSQSGLASDAWDVNQAGLAVGQQLDSSGNQVATLWTLNASLVVGALPGGDDSFAHAVNDRHFFVGSSATSGHVVFHAFVGYFGALSDLHELVPWAGGESHAWDINEAGQIAGEVSDASLNARALVWHPNGSIEELGSLGGANSGARGINEAGDVVGSSETAGGEAHAFLSAVEPSAPGGRVLLDLGKLAGGNLAEGLDVNSRREVVGWADVQTEAGTKFVAMYWSDSVGLIDLNAYVADPDWRLEQAESINERGDVVGYGWHGPSGDQRGFLLRRGVKNSAVSGRTPTR